MNSLDQACSPAYSNVSLSVVNSVLLTYREQHGGKGSVSLSVNHGKELGQMSFSGGGEY